MYFPVSSRTRKPPPLTRGPSFATFASPPTRTVCVGLGSRSKASSRARRPTIVGDPPPRTPSAVNPIVRVGLGSMSDIAERARFVLTVGEAARNAPLKKSGLASAMAVASLLAFAAPSSNAVAASPRSFVKDLSGLRAVLLDRTDTPPATKPASCTPVSSRMTNPPACISDTESPGKCKTQPLSASFLHFSPLGNMYAPVGEAAPSANTNSGFSSTCFFFVIAPEPSEFFDSEISSLRDGCLDRD